MRPEEFLLPITLAAAILSPLACALAVYLTQPPAPKATPLLAAEALRTAKQPPAIPQQASLPELSPKPVGPTEAGTMEALLPILRELPVGAGLEQHNALKQNTSASYAVAVDDAPSGTLVEQAESAATEGRVNEAIRLYTKVLENDAGDNQTRHNLVALLLEKAATLDEQGSPIRAVRAYEQALSYWGREDATAQSIRARVAYLKAGRRVIPAAAMETE